METLTWSKANPYRWNCKEMPGVCISAAKVDGSPVYTMWRGNEAVFRPIDSNECKAMAFKFRSM